MYVCSRRHSCRDGGGHLLEQSSTPWLVGVAATNVSLPRSDACPGAYAVADLLPHAIVDARSNESGELVAKVEAGRYSLFISRDDTCATCGLADGGIGCLIDIPRGAIVTRDLVFDEAAH